MSETRSGHTAPGLSAAAVAEQLTEMMPKLEADYREFHTHPELSMQETWTAGRIEEHLHEIGLETQRFGGTGVVAVIANGEGPVVAYRADTDGLPIAEDTGLEYSSTARGTLPDGSESPVMHGCGHDTHITVGLGIARLLSANREAWSGTVIMIFQPGEETGQGALAMLDDGMWDQLPRPQAVYGQHVWPERAGTVNVSVGTAMAMADCLRVTVHGKQAHGSQPEAAIDPIVLAAFMITRLQTVVSREISAREAVVVTIATIRGGLKENIIPDSAEFTMNIRTFGEEVREEVLGAIERIIYAEAEASGAPKPTIEEMYRFPRCYNNPQHAEELLEVFAETLGEDKVSLGQPATGSEDVGRFGDSIDVPYVYWFFGGYSEEKMAAPGGPAGNHSPFFAPDEVPETLSAGVRTGVAAIMHELGRK
ncbi:amidohydrolase [Brevibacterium luteolum]|uniref:amidohydrolase n=1 Tax=Brevibacterium luteolum TaxID=199591 RepID=UPI001C2227BB|nr:amidohydrolase [Brevibacterium luteolum]MBU8579027.1 amidohydrolase [Brevibacterium luteolum]